MISSKAKNWWYYYKWYVIGGVVLMMILGNLIASKFGWFKDSPDLQIAYIGTSQLPTDTITAIEQAFASLADDYNGDGKVLVQVNQYVSGNTESADTDTAYYKYASEITLIGDINDCESYFFLMDSPSDVQLAYQILAMPDGSCPGELDFSTDQKVFSWKDCHLLSDQELGMYTSTVLGQSISGENQELLSNLYLGRRCFYEEKRTAHADECAQLWNLLLGGLN